MKPDNKTIAKVLNEILPIIRSFTKKSYVELKKIFNKVENEDGDYLFFRLKFEKKEFAGFFKGLDPDNKMIIIDLLNLKMSEPLATLSKPPDADFKFDKLITGVIAAKTKWKYRPVEFVILNMFLDYALNHSKLPYTSLYEKKHIIDFKGWADYYLSVDNSEKLQLCEQIYKD